MTTTATQPEAAVSDTTKGKPGPPFGSHNAAKHGLTMTNRAAKMGDRSYRQLPRCLRYVSKEASKYASALYDDATAVLGDVGRDEWEAIQAAAAWELHRLNVLRVLRTENHKLRPEQRVAYSGEIAKAQSKRAEAVRRLNLRSGGNQSDPWETLHNGGSE